jgi:hypothetical protein
VEANVEKNGFLECWGELALRENPFILDLVKLGNINQKDNFINYFIQIMNISITKIVKDYNFKIRFY